MNLLVINRTVFLPVPFPGIGAQIGYRDMHG